MKAVAKLDRLYSELPSLECQGKCSDSCGPLLMSRLEDRRIHQTHGRGHDFDPVTLACILLKDGRCTVYSIRPAICRLWGLAEGLECHYGCKPERYLTRAEGRDFLNRVAELSDRTDVMGRIP